MHQFLKSSCLALALCVAPALPASLDNPAYLLEVMQGSDTPPRKVATAADLSPTHDAEDKAREAMKRQ